MPKVCLGIVASMVASMPNKFRSFCQQFLWESGPTSYKMHLWGMLYSWYGSVPVEYDARPSIT